MKKKVSPDTILGLFLKELKNGKTPDINKYAQYFKGSLDELKDILDIARFIQGQDVKIKAEKNFKEKLGKDLWNLVKRKYGFK